jgi:hypothetical protein
MKSRKFAGIIVTFKSFSALHHAVIKPSVQAKNLAEILSQFIRITYFDRCTRTLTLLSYDCQNTDSTCSTTCYLSTGECMCSGVLDFTCIPLPSYSSATVWTVFLHMKLVPYRHRAVTFGSVDIIQARRQHHVVLCNKWLHVSSSPTAGVLSDVAAP